MNDPWEEFQQAAAGAEASVYFERAARLPHGTGVATWSTELDPVQRISSGTEWPVVGRRLEQLRRTRPGRPLFVRLNFEAVRLAEPALRELPIGGPFPLGEIWVPREVHEARVARRPTSPSRTRPPAEAPAEDTLPRAEYVRRVRTLQREIREGESFQVVLARRKAWKRPSDLLSRAGVLRRSERYTHYYYLRAGNREYVGATPESVAEVRHGHAYVNPIAGTRPHGAGPSRLALRRDPKELAEHRMLVDLARNDLGRVGRVGSVRILERERSHRYARVEHLVSRVRCRLRAGVDAWEVLRGTFPAGTVSGAPKIRATELLRREEGTWRGPYAGVVGRLDSSGDADWSLAIRGAFAEGERLYTAAGAGIVFRSRPGQEFDETEAKLAQVERALVGAGR